MLSTVHTISFIQLNILEGGHVCMEFFKNMDHCKKVTEMMTISSDGKNVGILKLNLDFSIYFVYER